MGNNGEGAVSGLSFPHAEDRRSGDRLVGSRDEGIRSTLPRDRGIVQEGSLAQEGSRGEGCPGVLKREKPD